jgi:hypothetical protein
MGGTESDIPADPHVANSRQAGGRRSNDEADTHSSTGTSENDTYVGRVAGQDPGFEAETGAEARAWRDQEPEDEQEEGRG